VEYAVAGVDLGERPPVVGEAAPGEKGSGGEDRLVAPAGERHRRRREARRRKRGEEGEPDDGEQRRRRPQPWHALAHPANAARGVVRATARERAVAGRDVVPRRVPGVERRGERGHRLEAVLRPLREGAGDRVRDRTRHVRADVAGRGRHLGDLPVKDRPQRVALERIAAGEEAVADDRQRVLIGAVVERPLADRLLGAHAVRRPDERPRPGERRRRAVAHAGDAEVGEHRPPLRPLEQDVLRLDVAVDDPGPVGGAERRGRFAEDATRLGDGELLSPIERRGETPAVDQRHGEERRPLTFPDGVDGDDVGVPQLGDRLGLAVEALEQGDRGDEVAAQGLHGNLPLQPPVVGDVHLGEAAAAEQAPHLAPRAECRLQPGVARPRVLPRQLREAHLTRVAVDLLRGGRPARRAECRGDRKGGGACRTVRRAQGGGH
jgi:hypothetical protein